jgi:type II secretory ATPase GspE/PulE/Tfp pilus assembly ATPase PilB-like protein
MKEISEEKLKFLGIEKKENILKTDIDVLKSSKYKNKEIFILLDTSIIVKNAFNIYLPEIKSELKNSKVYLINNKLFDNLNNELFSSYSNFLELTNNNTEIEEDYKLDNTEISKVLNNIFISAKKRKVSDIHILPKEKHTEIRFRENGELIIVNELPKYYAEFLVNKIKTESKLDISNKLTPQDGKLKLEIDNDLLEIRVSTLPTVFGENSVLRIQDITNLSKRRLEDAGFEKEDLEIYRNKVRETYGLVLNVGGTGAGKTNTFHLTISELIEHFPNKNIMTAEDPVEIKNEKITQIEIDEKQKRTYPVVLKSLLRQDPDIILIGEIRDMETASIGIKSSLSGHLVLATLHANDSVNAITRLRDIGIEDHLISSTASCFLSQRLVKKLCPHCKKERDIPIDLKLSLNLEFSKDFIPVGCEECNHKGYIDRIAVIEVLDIEEDLKSYISNGKSEVDIKKILKKKNFKNLWTNGLIKVKEGITTIEEIQTHIKRDAILNYNLEESENQKVDTRIIFYPDIIINSMIKDKICSVFDISDRGISFIFEEPYFLTIGKEIEISVETERIKFIPKGYGKYRDKFLVSGIYVGDLKKFYID